MTEGYMLANCETASIIARRIGYRRVSAPACSTFSSGGTVVEDRNKFAVNRSHSWRDW